MMYPKDRPVRDERYRRLVAALPCCACGIYGHSQAAHPNTGKGLAMKASDDLCFPLCGPRYMERGCHAALDQGALFDKETRRRIERQWSEQTRQTLQSMGLI